MCHVPSSCHAPPRRPCNRHATPPPRPRVDTRGRAQRRGRPDRRGFEIVPVAHRHSGLPGQSATSGFAARPTGGHSQRGPLRSHRQLSSRARCRCPRCVGRSPPVRQEQVEARRQIARRNPAIDCRGSHAVGPGAACSGTGRFRDGAVRRGWDTCDMSLKALTNPRHVARGLDRRGPVKRPRTGSHRPGPDTEGDAFDARSP